MSVLHLFYMFLSTGKIKILIKDSGELIAVMFVNSCRFWMIEFSNLLCVYVLISFNLKVTSFNWHGVNVLQLKLLNN